jgi:nucleoside-diphosphate-sugar epimerase
MNCLLTGSNGFLGRFIFDALKNEYNVYTLSRTSGNYLVNLDSEVPNFNENFDIVIHCAGKAHLMPKSNDEESDFFHINVDGTKNLLNALKIRLPKQFVFISSVSVYGLQIGSNISESNLLLATDPYGLSKIYAEALVTEWCEKNNVVCTILRLPLVVGKNPPGNLGLMIKAIRGRYYFNIAGGKARKSMVLAQDVVEFIPVVSKIGGIYNLTDGYHPSFKEISDSLSKKQVFSLPLIIAKYLGKIGDITGNVIPINSMKILKMTSDLTFDDSKAKKIGWNPRDVLDYINSNDLFNK